MRTSVAIGLTVLLVANASSASGATTLECRWHFHSPHGELQRFEGVYFSYIDNVGFVPCSVRRDCQAFSSKQALQFSSARGAWSSFENIRSKYGENWGDYKIVFFGRRGRISVAKGCEATLPYPPDYVRMERLISAERLADVAN